MISHAKLFLCFCLVCSASSGESPSEQFSGLFRVITNALAASGAQDTSTRQQQLGNRHPQQGISSSVYEALQTITRNDDLECVPRLLCEAVAGGYPGGSRQLNIDKYSLKKLVSYLQLDKTNPSPMLTFGRAVVLGLSNRGDPYSCIVNYPKCPKDQKRLLHYLNNHRGGFFRFFDMKPTYHNYYGPNNYYNPYPSKPNYYYSRNPDGYALKEGEETYAKKYGHPGFRFQGGSSVSTAAGNRIVFPSERSDESEPRIQTKIVRTETGSARPGGRGNLVFVDSQRYGKRFKDSSFFPHYINAVAKPTSHGTDRLPSKFHFPQREAGAYLTKFPESTFKKGSFFPVD